MVIGILNFGDGLLWLTYLIFCTIGSLGVLQIAAARARLVGLLLLPPKASRWLGAALITGALMWFFTVQPDLFIPGLAGGEFFVEFFIGFGLAVVIALGLGVFSNRILTRAAVQLPDRREVVTWAKGQSAELWLPDNALPPLVLALREAPADALDVLSSHLVASGTAVLLCDQTVAPEAIKFAHQHAERFHRVRRYVVGVGRGADRALQLAATEPTIRGVLALAPFGQEVNARAGLRWLGETDYVRAFRATRSREKIEASVPPNHALVVYGDEDMLIRPEVARGMYPSAVMIAGARHWTLAAMPATLKLAADLFELHLPAASIKTVPSRAEGVHGELGE